MLNFEFVRVIFNSFTSAQVGYCIYTLSVLITVASSSAFFRVSQSLLHANVLYPFLVTGIIRTVFCACEYLLVEVPIVSTTPFVHMHTYCLLHMCLCSCVIDLIFPSTFIPVYAVLLS